MRIKKLKGLYTMAGVSDLVGTHQSAVLRAIRAGTLRAYETDCGKTTLLKLSDVKAWRENYKVGRPEGSKGKKKSA